MPREDEDLLAARPRFVSAQSVGGAPQEQPDHFGFDRGFVDEDEPVRFEPHLQLAAQGPEAALLGDVSASAFRRHQRFMEWLAPFPRRKIASAAHGTEVSR